MTLDGSSVRRNGKAPPGGDPNGAAMGLGAAHSRFWRGVSYADAEAVLMLRRCFAAGFSPSFGERLGAVCDPAEGRRPGDLRAPLEAGDEAASVVGDEEATEVESEVHGAMVLGEVEAGGGCRLRGLD